MQNNFCKGDSLGVETSGEIIPVINWLREKFDLVYCTMDWHPEDHLSFAINNPNGVPF